MSSDASAVLALPYIQPAQAQKHVTHNEALRLLDVLVQLAVTSRSQASPPASPAAGDRYLVPADALEGFAGQEGRIALWDGDGWAFVAPLPGWQAQVLDEGLAVVFDGTGWMAPADRGHSFGTLGIQATADATNRLAVSAPATLLTHAGAGHQLKVNKAAPGDTASLLFQTGWSGRAEMGTIGAEDFEIRTSPDGSTFHTALRAGAADGRLAAPAGLSVGHGSAAAPGLAFENDADTGLLRPAADQIGLATGGIQRALLSAAGLVLSVPLSGPAVTQSATDTTAGRLTKVGDGGIMGDAILLTAASDIDTLGANGMYCWGSSVPATAPGSASFCQMLHVQRSSASRSQLVFQSGSGATNVWFRGYTTSAWQPWRRILHLENLVGTVSQSAGVPTGAAIERGSNANGQFVRFADGTQICRRTITLASGAETTWTFPAAFSSTPVVTGTAQAPVLSAVVLDSAATTTGVALSARDKTDARRADPAHVSAIGRWFEPA